MTKQSYPLSKLAEFVSAQLQGSGDVIITGFAPLHKACAGHISFLENPRYREYLRDTQATAVILTSAEACNAVGKNLLIVPDPYVAYAKLTALFDDVPCLSPGVHPTVVIGTNCTIDATASIGAYCVIGDDVKVGAQAQIASGCHISTNSEIGAETKLYANVSVYHNVRIGKRGIIHSGAVIGADGFGMANERGVWCKIHQLGGVVIGDDVEIGANTTIDRGALEDTVVDDGVKLDNQIQVAHNVHIGAHTAIAGCVGIAGSTTIGKHCMIGGGVGIAGHIDICDGVILTARSAVHKSITAPGMYAGAIPAIEHRAWWRVLKRLMQLDELFRRVTKLETDKHE